MCPAPSGEWFCFHKSVSNGSVHLYPEANRPRPYRNSEKIFTSPQKNAKERKERSGGLISTGKNLPQFYIQDQPVFLCVLSRPTSVFDLKAVAESRLKLELQLTDASGLCCRIPKGFWMSDHRFFMGRSSSASGGACHTRMSPSSPVEKIRRPSLEKETPLTTPRWP